MQEWIKTRVARHKFLRGGTYLPFLTQPGAHTVAVFRCGCCRFDTEKVSFLSPTTRIASGIMTRRTFTSAAGKILRRELRDRAKAELLAESRMKAKL